MAIARYTLLNFNRNYSDGRTAQVLNRLSTIDNKNYKSCNKANITRKYSQYSHKAPRYSEKQLGVRTQTTRVYDGWQGVGRHH